MNNMIETKMDENRTVFVVDPQESQRGIYTHECH
jgi:hypothetical protein